MVATISALHSPDRRRARRLLLASTVAYFLLATGVLIYALLTSVDVPLPKPDWPWIAHAAFFTAFLFPAISVASLLAGWVFYVSGSYALAMIGALIPWAWGLLAIVSSLSVTLP